MTIEESLAVLKSDFGHSTTISKAIMFFSSTPIFFTWSLGSFFELRITFLRYLHLFSRLLISIGAFFPLVHGQEKAVGGDPLASYKGSFSSADVEIRIEPDGDGLKAKLQYKASPFTAKASIQGRSAVGDFTDGIDTWTFTLTPNASGLVFQTGSFQSNLIRNKAFTPGEYSSDAIRIKLEIDGTSPSGTLEFNKMKYNFLLSGPTNGFAATPQGGGDKLTFTLMMDGDDLIFNSAGVNSRLKLVTETVHPVQPQHSAGDSSLADKPSLRVTSDKREYVHGDVMQITVDIPHDGFLRLYGVSADGSTALLFPNKWVQDDKVTKGKMILPGEKADYDFMLALDEGQTKVTESVHAVFSSSPFADSGKDRIKFGSAKFEAIGTTTSSQRNTRGLTPTAKASSFSVETIYDLNR